MLTPKDADAHGAKRLMGAKGKEIGAELAHVDCHVRRRLRTVYYHVGAVGMCRGGNLFHRIAHAEDIRDLADGDNLGSGPDLCGDFIIGDDSLAIGTQVDRRGAGFAASLLPGNEIGVMLHDTDDNLVASFEDRGRKALGNKIERLTRIAREHDVVCKGLARVVDGANQGGDLCAHLRNRLGCLDGKRVESAQRVGVHRLIEMSGRVKHTGGALRGGGAV